MNPQTIGHRKLNAGAARRSASRMCRHFGSALAALAVLGCPSCVMGQHSTQTAAASELTGNAAAHYASAANGLISYVSWRDPKEGAFTTEVPRGWKVTGGLYRFAPIDVRPQVAAGPTDGSMLVQMGDVVISTFAPPGPSSQMRGLHNGQSYSVNGVTYMVMPYQSGEQFSKAYVQSRLGRLHPGLQVTTTRERSELAAEVDRRMSAGGQGKSSMGETKFTFTEDGKTVHGVCLARTQMIGQGLGAVWTAFPCTAMSKRGGVSEGKGVMEHMLLRTKDDPQWSAGAQQTAHEFSQLVLANHERALAEMNRIYTRFTHQLAEDGRVWSNILNNQEDVRNPSTGQTFKAEAGHNYYSLDKGSPVGSNQPLPGQIPLEKF